MDYALISVVAFLASVLTLFSGFGLGTLLMPVVAIFFPIEVAIAMTAMVHFANNVFKLSLVGRKADVRVLWRFGMPAVVMAFIGAFLLFYLSQGMVLYQYSMFGRVFQVSLIQFMMGVLILFFVFVDVLPRFSEIKFDSKYLFVGGALSGFFGGLSGHQGAFRSMFLSKVGLSAEAFVATGVVLAVMVDVSRLLVYGWDLSKQSALVDWHLVVCASLSAFAGAYLGAKLLKKITVRFVQYAVSVVLVLIAFGMIFGVV